MAKQLVAATPGGDRIELADYEGKLLLIEPLEIERGIETTHGTADATRANVFVILSKDGSKYEEHEDVLLFQRVLQSQLRKVVGKSVVFGRLVKGEKKPGKNPPWTLADPTASDTSAASAFWASRSLAGASSASSDEEFDGDDGDAF